MKRTYLAMAALAGMMATPVGQARAATVNVVFSGPGVSGALVLTYGTATDAKYSNAFEVTGISGSFSDSNNGLDIVNAPVGSLVPINHAVPEPTNLLAPNDFSRFAVAAGLPAVNNGFLTYDNLFWPGGAPPTASDFPGAGSFLDIYGLMFSIGNGEAVDLFSNGIGFGPPGAVFGVAVATADTSLDYVADGVTAAVPELSTWGMMLLGFTGLGFVGYRRAFHSRCDVSGLSRLLLEAGQNQESPLTRLLAQSLSTPVIAHATAGKRGSQGGTVDGRRSELHGGSRQRLRTPRSG
jgi:hypothetical protein